LTKIIKSLKAVLLPAAGIIALASLCLYSVYTSSTLPEFRELSAIDNISKKLPINQRRVLKKSRDSAVRVLSFNKETGNIATSTGTYISALKKEYILTVFHGIISDCDNTKILVEDEFFDCDEFIELDVSNDYAIIKLKRKIKNRKPVNVLRDVPHGHRWKRNLSVLTDVYYTGYPNSAGPLSFAGKIAGLSSDDYLYINSYAWSGASGSGVFSENGKLIGYIVAIDVGGTEFGMQVLENVIFVVPLYRVDWKFIFK
jgi:hypothetical protein|tara:strand:- start:575 stop:1345 length:771 start_codon:yes stop_codon:yes gene_type:complete